METKAEYNNSKTMTSDYFIGLPQWKHPEWNRSLLQNPEQGDLEQYAASFNSVEGNTTFYGLPGVASVRRWGDETPPGFRFCFKFPQSISHQGALRHVSDELSLFLDRLQPLASKLGMLCLQLPSRFGPEHLPELVHFLGELPAGLRYAVEVRHLAFFQRGEEERRFNDVLERFGVNRISFDTRALFANPQSDPITREALQQKPRLPLRVLATGDAPMLRFISPLDLQQGQRWLRPWVGQVLRWIEEGRTPFIFMHTPSNGEAPELARWFAQELQQRQPKLAPGFYDWTERTPVRRQPGLF
ncbi:DUF72 domain-containing protein [Marinobacterium sediminicola]|uniref:Uncharacterized conserved protein YecE, DUF72 family n=1 Tax=Marinobacterium sediminicola TaxID=518898 RepID=A0ABY1RY97_9GAMM|nr:DUF72 domain-containing protein [Marinobacterium sediminicola]ULG68703.1 DUF72 domain-containing protein [Marinobacterium sediminicola]SMR73228.1 Uncharacterized conserved protein YecE, DUF72 family [Marinobacterium sediminicola]